MRNAGKIVVMKSFGRKEAPESVIAKLRGNKHLKMPTREEFPMKKDALRDRLIAKRTKKVL